ncbi:uncharacterized protein METZ01_LOCUS513041 [marine metagenome]|uniref:Uncharacterized protein n=1 Tax=marine metagenome TaxID=408172 RepID=A0A383ETL2_9ZZZZ
MIENVQRNQKGIDRKSSYFDEWVVTQIK